MDSIDPQYLPTIEQERYDFFYALYEFNKSIDTNLSVQQNLQAILKTSEKDENIEAQHANLFTLEMPSEYLTEMDQMQQRIQYLQKNLAKYEGLLNQLLSNDAYRQKVQDELQQILFGPKPI